MTSSPEDIFNKITTSPGRYDLPLPRSMGSGFLVLLVALMTCLTVFACTGSFVLSDISHRWSSGLESALTVEVPAQSNTDIHQVTETIAGSLRNLKSVSSATVLKESDMKELLSPWMGQDSRILETAPLPGIISVELRDSSENTINEVKTIVQKLVPSAFVDRHQDWLSHVLKLSGALKFASILILLIITLTTITAVAGAVRAQMATFHDQIEILHLMGAKDHYISTQFARHAIFLGLRGACIGFGFSIFSLLLLKFFSAPSPSSVFPDFTLGISGWIALCGLPLLACLIVMITAYLTVHRTLQSLP